MQKPDSIDLRQVTTNDNDAANTYNKTKATFSALWNNVKYEFHSKFYTKFNPDSPICLLGQFYHQSDQCASSSTVYDNFLSDFNSRIWLTYRKNFPSLLQTNITTDSGWGCMVRSCQMLLAQGLLLHFLGRHWRWKGRHSDKEDMIHRMIVKWFADNPIQPFSIHQFVEVGQKAMGKRPGSWFGPVSVSFVIKEILDRVSNENPILSDICCYVTQDCTVYLQDVLDICTTISTKISNQTSNSTRKKSACLNQGETSCWRSVLMLVPVRLGGEQFNTHYTLYLKRILAMPYCIGIIGGKPRHSLYFIGFQEDKLIYIDPHYCQKSVDVTQADFPLDSFHCFTPRKLSLLSIDPSCAFGFYLKSKAELDEFVDCVRHLSEQAPKVVDYPVFSIDPGRSVDREPKNDGPDRILQLNFRLVDLEGNVQSVNTEEFILL